MITVKQLNYRSWPVIYFQIFFMLNRCELFWCMAQNSYEILRKKMWPSTKFEYWKGWPDFLYRSCCLSEKVQKWGEMDIICHTVTSPLWMPFSCENWRVHLIRVSGFRRALQSQAATQQFCLSPKGGNSGCLFDALWGLKTYFLTVTFSNSNALIKELGYKKTIALSWSHPVVISFKMSWFPSL